MSRARAAAERRSAAAAKALIATTPAKTRLPASVAVRREAAASQGSATGLASVTISPDLNCDVQTNVDANGSFFGDDACATLFSVDGTMYGPANIPAGPGFGNLTPVSQNTSGDGTESSPTVVTTVVDLGSTGITATETDTWAVGATSFTTSVEVDNGDSTAHSVIVYRAGDCYFNDSDAGFGEVGGLAGLPAGAVACRSAFSTTNAEFPGNRMMEWVPQTPGNTYVEDEYANMWSAVGTGGDLPDNCLCTTFIDNGMALAWSGTLGAGASASYDSEILFNDNAPGSAPGAGEQGTGPNPSEYSTTCYTQDPVNCATGDFFRQFTDFSVPGRGVALSLERSYSSASAGTDGPFGFGWTDGYAMSLSTDPSGDATITQEDGTTVTFQPDGSGGFAAPPRVFATLTQNPDGSYVFTRQRTQVQYAFSSTGQLVSETDRNGYVTTLAYDGSGRLATVTDPAGRTLTFGYSGSSNHVSTVTDPLGRTFSYTYDGVGDLSSAIDPLGRTWTFTYDPGHLLLTMTDPRGGTVTNVYDGSGRVVSQTDPAGLKTTWAYTGDNSSAAGGTTTMTDPHGNQTAYAYIDLELMALTRGAGTPDAATTSYTYDPATLGQATVTDPNGNVTTRTFDGNGNLASTTDPLGNTTFYSYDSLDDLTSQQSPAGETTSYAYDGSGNLLTVTDPMGNVTTYAYDDASHPGDVTSVTDQDGRVTTYTYDSDGDRASAVVQPSAGQSDTTKWAYDADGEVVCEAPANATATGVSCPGPGGARVAGTITTSYDADGEVAAVTDADGNVTSYGYDADGNRTKITDPSGNTTTTSFDPDNRATSVTAGANGSSPSVTTTAYDLTPGSGPCTASVTSATYCTATTDPGGNVSVDYFGARDQIVEQSKPGGLVTQYAYDPAGNLISKTDAAGRVTTYGYDADDELTSENYSDGTTPAVGYTYDVDGRRASMTDGTGTTTYSYDVDGRVTEVTNGAGASVSYTYDNRGDITSLTYPNDEVVTRTYDGAGRLVSVQDWLGNTTTFGYDADGNLTQTTYPNGDTVRSRFDNADQLTATQVASTGSSTPLAGIAYARNADGLVTQETDTGALTGTTSYSYDARNELTGAGAATFAYDASGDPTTLGTTTQAFNAAGQLTTATSVGATSSYGYDGVGDLTSLTRPSGTVTGYGYDQNENLTSVTIPTPAVTGIAPGSGIPGTKVTITGTGFTNASAVKFGGKAAAFTVLSDSQISATTPAGTGTVDVRVTTPGGTSPAVSADRFSYTRAPQVTAVTPSAGPLAGGTKVTITGTGFTGATAVHFGTKSAKFTVGSATSITATAPAGTGTVNVTVTTPAGTSAVSATDRYSYRTKPSVAKVSPVAGPLGGGTKVKITGANFTGATAVRFGSKKAKFTVNSATSITAISPAGTGTVDVKVTSPGGTSAASTADHFSYLAKPAVTGVKPHTGPAAGRTKVTISGRNFTRVSSVKFGTKKAAFKVTSAKSISATAPAGHGTVDITVTTPGGTSAKSKADHFTYTTKVSTGLSSRADVVGPAVTYTYSYNGDELRMSATSPAGTQQFAWATAPSGPVLLTDGTYNFIYGPDQLPIEEISADGTPAYFFHDSIGSTRALLTPAGSVAATFSYSPYGSLISATGTLSSPIAFAGAYLDGSTSLYYLIHRNYDSSTGRFLTIDPAVNWSLTAYGYAAGDPLNETDPLGLITLSQVLHDTGTVAGVVGLGAAAVVACAASFCTIDAAVVGGALVVGTAATAVGVTSDAASTVVDCGNARDATCGYDVGSDVLDVATLGTDRIISDAARPIFDLAAGATSLTYNFVTGRLGGGQPGSAGLPESACQGANVLQPSVNGAGLQGGTGTGALLQP